MAIYIFTLYAAALVFSVAYRVLAAGSVPIVCLILMTAAIILTIYGMIKGDFE